MIEIGQDLELRELEFSKTEEEIKLKAEAMNAHSLTIHTSVSGAKKIMTGYILVRKTPGNVTEIPELRICVVGNVDSGKSTSLGVLTKDILDDGRGKARVNLFKHKHELESGRTSSIGYEIMGFDETGRVITPTSLGKSKIQWDDVCLNASKVITFIDLAGHARYLKTTVAGMTGNAPDFVMLIVGSNSGIIGMTKEHLALALALQVPVFVIITKVDMCPTNILEETIKQVTKILRSSGI